MKKTELLFITKRYEQKLLELMGEDEFGKFVNKVAKETFINTIEEMEPSDFKDFCQANLGKILGGDPNG